MIVLAGALSFGVLAFALTRFVYKQDWRWAVFAGLVCACTVTALLVPIHTHADRLDMPSGR
jgi:hypothetical protein